MLRRLFVGLAEGLVIGLAMALAVIRGLGLRTPSALLAAALAGGAGLLVGLVAGRPIWARDAKTEALLKAGVGALVGAGLSFALGRWWSMPVDLSAYSLGAGAAGTLAVLTLPAIACALSLFFELDNTDGAAKPRISAPRGKQRLAAPEEPAQGAEHDSLDELDELAEHKREKR
jgi:hypothetical protein